MKQHLIAFDPAVLQRLKDTKECAKCNLSGANLTGADLSFAELAGAGRKSGG